MRYDLTGGPECQNMGMTVAGITQPDGSELPRQLWGPPQPHPDARAAPGDSGSVSINVVNQATTEAHIVFDLLCKICPGLRRIYVGMLYKKSLVDEAVQNAAGKVLAIQLKSLTSPMHDRHLTNFVFNGPVLEYLERLTGVDKNAAVVAYIKEKDFNSPAELLDQIGRDVFKIHAGLAEALKGLFKQYGGPLDDYLGSLHKDHLKKLGFSMAFNKVPEKLLELLGREGGHPSLRQLQESKAAHMNTHRTYVLDELDRLQDGFGEDAVKLLNPPLPEASTWNGILTIDTKEISWLEEALEADAEFRTAYEKARLAATAAGFFKDNVLTIRVRWTKYTPISIAAVEGTFYAYKEVCEISYHVFVKKTVEGEKGMDALYLVGDAGAIFLDAGTAIQGAMQITNTFSTDRYRSNADSELMRRLFNYRLPQKSRKKLLLAFMQSMGSIEDRALPAEGEAITDATNPTRRYCIVKADTPEEVKDYVHMAFKLPASGFAPALKLLSSRQITMYLKLMGQPVDNDIKEDKIGRVMSLFEDGEPSVPDEEEEEELVTGEQVAAFLDKAFEKGGADFQAALGRLKLKHLIAYLKLVKQPVGIDNRDAKAARVGKFVQDNGGALPEPAGQKKATPSAKGKAGRAAPKARGKPTKAAAKVPAKKTAASKAKAMLKPARKQAAGGKTKK